VAEISVKSKKNHLRILIQNPNRIFWKFSFLGRFLQYLLHQRNGSYTKKTENLFLTKLWKLHFKCTLKNCDLGHPKLGSIFFSFSFSLQVLQCKIGIHKNVHHCFPGLQKNISFGIFFNILALFFEHFFNS